jgi:hypothetical protein
MDEASWLDGAVHTVGACWAQAAVQDCLATILTKGKHMTILIRGTQTFADLLTGESVGYDCMLDRCLQVLC